MNILTCYKIVYEEQDIALKSDGTLSFDSAELKLGLYDLNAVEAGVEIAKATNGSLKVLSVGDDKIDNSKLKKAILSRGPEELFLVKDSSLTNIDALQTAKILANAAKKISHDLILCGDGSSDIYAQQVGIQLAEILDIPVINSVSKITPQDNKVTVERTLEDSVEVLEIQLPAVICVTSDINNPKVPGMKDILAAGKKPVTEWGLNDIDMTCPDNSIEVISVLAPKKVDRKCIVLEGDDKVAELYEQIKNEL